MGSRKLIERIKELLEERARKAYEAAKEDVLNEEIDYEPLRDALQYFIQELWHDSLHPALLSLSCESVGGKPENTTSIGAALVLLTGAADIHDDIIDQSGIKGAKPTVLGKFGRDIALLVGDALLLKGFTLLSKACETLPKEQRKKIMELVKEAFFEIGIAEAKETSLRGNWNLAPEEFLAIIEMKATIVDASSRIGAILGAGSFEQIEAFGKYGRTLGTLVILREEFINMFEPDELRNRAENECLPLPILYAFRNPEAKDRIIKLLRKKELTQDDAVEIAEIITATKEDQTLANKMKHMMEEGKKSLMMLKLKRHTATLGEMLHATLVDL